MDVKLWVDSADWIDVYNAAMTTVSKEPKVVEPDSKWKRRILMAEHSPIRLLRVHWVWVDLPYWVSVHFVRHNIGITHFVKSQRSEPDRDLRPQGELVTHECVANAQSIINISRKRLCFKAAEETREAWELMLGELARVEPELASVCTKECCYRGFCPEMKSCGYIKTNTVIHEREKYLERWEIHDGRPTITIKR